MRQTQLIAILLASFASLLLASCNANLSELRKGERDLFSSIKEFNKNKRGHNLALKNRLLTGNIRYPEKKTSLAGAIFHKAKFTNLQLTDVDMTSAQFSQTLFENGEFLNVTLNNASFKDVTFKNVKFVSLGFDNASFEDVTFDNCEFHDVRSKKTNFKNVAFKNTDFYRTSFDESTLAKVNWSECEFHRSAIADSSLTDVNLNNFKWIGGGFYSNSVHRMEMSKIEIFEGTISRGDYTQLKITDSAITESGIAGAKFKDVIFDNVSLIETSFMHNDFHNLTILDSKLDKFHIGHGSIDAFQLEGSKANYFTLYDVKLKNMNVKKSLFTFTLDIDSCELEDVIFENVEFADFFSSVDLYFSENKIKNLRLKDISYGSRYRYSEYNEANEFINSDKFKGM
jgi:uncharacterized protein YjbI with pentapeptide repeats